MLKGLLKIEKIQDAISKVKKLAEDKIAKNENADEFVEIAEADDFKIYVAAGETVTKSTVGEMRESPRDVFMLVLEGEVEFTFEKGERQTVKAGECFVLPKHLLHQCVFKKMTIALEGVYEKGL